MISLWLVAQTPLPGSDPLSEKLWLAVILAVVGQAVVGGLSMIGFVAVSKRFMNQEVPAQLSQVNRSIDALHQDASKIGEELIQMRREIDLHGYKIASLEDWRKDRERERDRVLDETHNGAPRRRRTDDRG